MCGGVAGMSVSGRVCGDGRRWSAAATTYRKTECVWNDDGGEVAERREMLSFFLEGQRSAGLLVSFDVFARQVVALIAARPTSCSWPEWAALLQTPAFSGPLAGCLRSVFAPCRAPVSFLRPGNMDIRLLGARPRPAWVLLRGRETPWSSVWRRSHRGCNGPQPLALGLRQPTRTFCGLRGRLRADKHTSAGADSDKPSSIMGRDSRLGGVRQAGDQGSRLSPFATRWYQGGNAPSSRKADPSTWSRKRSLSCRSPATTVRIHHL